MELIRKNKKINKDNKRLKEEYKELTDLSERLSNIPDADDINEAKHRYNMLNNQKDNLPDEFVKALKVNG